MSASPACPPTRGLSPALPQERQWWWSEQIRRRVTGLAGATGPGRFTVHLDVPRDQLEATARALRAAVDEADAAFVSRYAADVHARHQLARERQEQQRRRSAEVTSIASLPLAIGITILEL